MKKTFFILGLVHYGLLITGDVFRLVYWLTRLMGLAINYAYQKLLLQNSY